MKDIRGNMTLLLDEIEPRRFVNMLHGFRNSETIIERITSKDPRKDRCRDFLNFIMKVGPNAVNKFIPELERQGSYHIIESLTPKTNTEHDGKLLLVYFLKLLINCFIQHYTNSPDLNANYFLQFCQSVSHHYS